MGCGCDRIIILDDRVLSNINSQFLSGDGALYLDLHSDTSLDQVDSLIELDPQGDLKTEAVIGGSVPATDKNRAILSRFSKTNPKEQNKKSIQVLALNGYKALDVDRMRIVYSDEIAYEIELIRGENHWAVAASNLKLHTLEGEDYEFVKETISESWNNYSYEDGDLGIYFPLAYYGATYREKKWTIEDFRPAHSMQFLLTKGFCGIGYEFSSPIFDTPAGKQMWLYCLGQDYGQEKEALEGQKFRVNGTEGGIVKLGNQALVSGDPSRVTSYFKGKALYRFNIELETLNIPPQFQAQTIESFTITIEKTSTYDPTFVEVVDKITTEYNHVDINNPVTPGEVFQTVSWEKELDLSPQDNLQIRITYTSFHATNEPLEDSTIPYRFSYYNEPIRTIYKRGDTVNVTDIISEELSLMDVLKGMAHLYGQMKLYLNKVTKQAILMPPLKTKWMDEVVEGYFKYDSVVTITQDIICETLQKTSPEFTGSRYNIIRYANTSNPKIKEYLEQQGKEFLHSRYVDFDNDFPADTEEWVNPTFEPVINAKLVKPVDPRPPLNFEAGSDGIDIMWMVDNLDGNMSYDIGYIPFIAHGSHYSVGESVDSNFLFFSVYFEDSWVDIPVSGQKVNGLLYNGGDPEEFKPFLVYGEYPLEDLFSVFWREYFYKQILGDTVSINIDSRRTILSVDDYRNIHSIPYYSAFVGWLNERQFNHCKTEGTKLTFVPDIQIEPECIDPDTIPPVEVCDKTNAPQIEFILEDCSVSYSQIGTIESNITGEAWLIRYEGESSFSPAPPSPFVPDGNFYLRYTAETDDEVCLIPPETVYVDICQENTIEEDITYTEGTDCYRIGVVVEGCNEYSDLLFETKDKADPDTSYTPVTVENPGDPVKDWYIEVCAPALDFCVRITPTISAGCAIDPVEACITLCPTEEDIICAFTEVSGGFKFTPDLTGIHKEPLTAVYEYDVDPSFSSPVEFILEDTLELMGTYYYRITLTFSECDTVIKICDYTRDASDCLLNVPTFVCNVESDGRLTFMRTGTVIGDGIDFFRYRKEGGEWIQWDGEPLADCPYEVQRFFIPCNECDMVCSPVQRCFCTGDPNPTPGDCSDFWVILKRYGDTLYAETPFVTSGMVFIFLKDGDIVQNSAINTLPLSGPNGEYIVKAIYLDCEDQDEFLYDSACIPPELTLGSMIDNDGVLTYQVDITNPGSNPQITVTHEYQISESETESTNIPFTYYEISGVIEFDITLEYGLNNISVSIENACGMALYEDAQSLPCPINDPGVSQSLTICEGCLGNIELVSLLGGTPDEGGTWFDINNTGYLNPDGSVDMDLLPVGEYEFLYAFNADSNICIQTSSISISVIERKQAGDNTVVDLCHDAGETDLFDLISGDKDPGGVWNSDSVIDGIIDLENGTITPAATDIGKQVVLSYSHNPDVYNGIVSINRCFLKSDGSDNIAQSDVAGFNFKPLIVAEFYTNNATGGWDVMGTWTGVDTSHHEWIMLQRTSDNSFGFVFRRTNDVAEVHVFSYTFTPGQWYRVEGFVDGADFVITIDGVEEYRDSGWVPTGDSNTLFTIGGRDHPTAGAKLDGGIRYVKVGDDEIFFDECSGSTLESTQENILTIENGVWDNEYIEEGVACDCLEYSILTINIIDCTPPPICLEDADLGLDVSEIANPSPSNANYEDKLVASGTGTYEDAGKVAADYIRFSNDDGQTWIVTNELTDDDYYVQLTSDLDTDCDFGSSTGYHQMDDLVLSNGENVQEAQLRSRLGTYNNNWTDIEPADDLRASGSSNSLINERYFRWDARHVLNSGWVLHCTRTLFDRGDPSSTCPNGSGSFAETYYSGHAYGKRKILIQRVIEYNDGCPNKIIPAEFQPSLPDCDVDTSGLGFDIVDPVSDGGGGWYVGSVECVGTIPGSTLDRVYVYERPSGVPGYAESSFNCGGSESLDLGYEYIFVRVIELPDCPPIILLHDYQADTFCPTASLNCTVNSSEGWASAVRTNNPSNLASDYMQYRLGVGTWLSYTEGQQIYPDSAITVWFRRVATYNNGCAQTSDPCNVYVDPPSWSVSSVCSGGDTINTSVSGLPSGGSYYLYFGGSVVDINLTGTFSGLSPNGTYRVAYYINNQFYNGNLLNCGSGGGGCENPTVNLGGCNESEGQIIVSFSTSEIDDIEQINVDTTAGIGQFIFNSGTGQGQVMIDIDPGQSTTITVTVTNDCGTDSDNIVCSRACSILSFYNEGCDTENNRTWFTVEVTPNTTTPPTSTTGVLVAQAGNFYTFRQDGLGGFVQADHPEACNPISKTIICDCSEPVVDVELACTNNQVQYSFTVLNEENVSGNYVFQFDDNPSLNYVVPNTGAGTYSGVFTLSGSSHTWKLMYTGCGVDQLESGSITCACVDPAFQITAVCATDEVTLDLVVTNESQVTGNYTILQNGSNIGSIVKTGAGTYQAILAVTAGNNYSYQIQATSACGGQVTSNIATANCGCPASSLYLSNIACDSETQILTFDINQSNVGSLVLTVNASPETITANPQSVQGVPGENIIHIQGTDSCASIVLEDSRTYNCGCDQPGLSLIASCDSAGVISYTLTVTNESRTSGDYTILRNGVDVGAITNTGAGTYNGTLNVTPGTNHTLRITVGNNCGSTTQSNPVSVNCGCPSSVLGIDNAVCNSSNQELTFDIIQSNVSNLTLKVNGITITPIPSNPITVQGQIGSNIISVTGEDSCSEDPLNDSVTLNCNCTTNPTIVIGTINETGGTITVPFSTTNINSAGQIVVVANGNTLGSKTNLGGGNWQVTFPAIEGTNFVSIQVDNECGSASDSDTYEYASCTPPTIVKVNQGINSVGQFYVNYVTSNCESISASPSPASIGGCGSGEVRWNVGDSVLNWEIQVTNSCGSDTISGSYNPCNECSGSITNLGCESGGIPKDVVFVVDGSTSFTGPGCWPGTDFPDAIESIKATIEDMETANPGIHRFAVCEYSSADLNIPGTLHWGYSQQSGNYFTTKAYIVAELNSYTRQVCGCAVWNAMWLGLLDNLGNGLNRRSGVKLEIVIIHDSKQYAPGTISCSNMCSPIDSDCYYERNLFVNQVSNMDITVVRFEDGSTKADNANAISAAMATKGDAWPTKPGDDNYDPNDYVASNGGDPEGSGGRRNHYWFNDPSGEAIDELTEQFVTNCKLQANINSGCPSAWTDSVTYTWSVLGGGGAILSGSGTNIITTNGVGDYQVIITLDTGCTITQTYSYILSYTQVKAVRTRKVRVRPKPKKLPKKVSDFEYDYSQLTESQKEILIGYYKALGIDVNYKDDVFKHIQVFYNDHVESEYYFSCGCDNKEVYVILKRYMDELGVEL